MRFLRPSMLWLLLLVAGLVFGYTYLQRRRRHYAVRFTNIELLESVAPRPPGWRRHVPAAAVGAALIASVIGLAQPVHVTQIPRQSAVVMLAIDVSASMAATDVSPDRLHAAITAAASFVEDLPEDFGRRPRRVRQDSARRRSMQLRAPGWNRSTPSSRAEWATRPDGARSWCGSSAQPSCC